MRITILHNHPIHYQHLLFSEMVAQGAHVNILFAAKSSTARTASLQPIGTGYQSHFLSASAFEDLPQIRSALRAVKLLEQCRPDVVIIGGYSYLPTWTTLAWAKLRHKPVVLWSESNLFDHSRQPTKELIKRIFVRMCDMGHVYGKSSREYLEFLGMPATHIIEKRATCDAGTFGKRRAVFHPDRRRFVFVGRFSPEKNLLRLLDAIAIVVGRLPELSIELLLVGYGPDEAMLRERVIALGLVEQVAFAGVKTQDEVSSLMAESDCLVLPSLSEPWGLVANEALCTGLPILVSNRCGCARDLITDDTGWSFEAEDTNELASRLEAISLLPVERLQAMGAACIRLASEYAPEKCARRILEYCEFLTHRDASLQANETCQT